MGVSAPLANPTFATDLGSSDEESRIGARRLDTFMATVPLLDRFRDGVTAANYAQVPEDWLIGTADVVASTQAIEHGHYKTVNMIGAGVIAAAMNATGSRAFPFVFGGDGAAFVVPPEWEPQARFALSAMRRWASDESDLRLRAAVVPVSHATRAGQQVKLARFAPSAHVSYAMFAGGGLAWAEKEMKAGRYDVPRAAEGIRPDLEGLSCRWQPADAAQGQIVSLIVAPGAYASAENADGVSSFEALEQRILQCLQEGGHDDGQPLTQKNIRFSLAARGADLEAKTIADGGPRFWNRIKVRAFALFVWSLFKFNLQVGAFDPKRYRNDLQANSDFRKFDDGLKLTVDCGAETIDRLGSILDAAFAAGIASYGMHLQKSALITCIVPSAAERDHMHFVDGAEGGYARAAVDLKRRQDTLKLDEKTRQSEDRRQHAD